MENGMSSFGVNRRVLPSVSANGFHSEPRSRVAQEWTRPAVEAVCDCAVVSTVAAPFSLRQAGMTLAAVSFCVAVLVVLLLANDGAYDRAQGPLGIRRIESLIRVSGQACTLILLVSAMVGGCLPPLLKMESALLETIALLAVENEITLSVFEALGVRSKSEERGEVDHLLDTMPASTGYASDLLKRLFDVLLSAAAIVATIPLWLFITGFIRLDSKGPVFFRQMRVGKNGRLFVIYKFRSMHTSAATYEESPNSSNDRRITRVGRYLRRTSLDELPQLLNVLRGEMSLVGPRPEMPFLVNGHHSEHQQRLEAIPGITGLWQLSSARTARIHENPQYDRYYVRHRNICLDLAILLFTPARVMRGI
jgi:lipopolysaccharide/colanic/teichoic acid biosynthesis glycosyltransferase